MALQVRYLGWDAFMLTTAQGTRILLDPFLSGYPEHHLPASPVSPEAIGPVDLVVVSHASKDHLGDSFAIMQKCQARLVCGPDVTLLADRAGIGGNRCALMIPGAYLRHADVWIKALDARHISWSLLDGRPMTGPPMCYIIRTDAGESLFFGGDTALTQDMRLWGELHRPQVALLGVGGALIEGRTVVEMEPAEAALAAEFLGVRTAIPMHWRSRADAEAFAQAVADRRLLCQAPILQPGDVLSLQA